MEENGRQVEGFGEQSAASEGWAAGGEWGQAAEQQQQEEVCETTKYSIPKTTFAGLVRG